MNVFEIKYEKTFQFKSTKHWRFYFHLIKHRILVEISGGHGEKLANKAWIVMMMLQRWSLQLFELNLLRDTRLMS